MNRRRGEQGFTLIEVMIALVVLAVGLLGMATLMTTSLQSSQGAYRRSQASLLAYDLVERMRVNRSQAITSDDYTLSSGAADASAPSCNSAGCTPQQQAQLDMYQWRDALNAALPDATATVTRANVNQYTVTINWTEVGSDMKNASNQTITPSFTLRIDL
ncbi:type IV pilus modification protein PilV [Pseudomonas citronellolis]|uniref:type IV pilus modification protein PilV n=1 Tax=Pseudomonas citronellolis TaxID=53408 RepID=UPI0021BF8FD6|nr:type IV pilus modification protein PilV [Pseudomonas citronellolis]MDN6871386.1 type IV pilus modification protein PilV [Pseudomonas citronellolis]UXJ51804.1 type IV pilus modification protein PilV [Pseudomonas citronellolis]